MYATSGPLHGLFPLLECRFLGWDMPGLKSPFCSQLTLIHQPSFVISAPRPPGKADTLLHSNMLRLCVFLTLTLIELLYLYVCSLKKKKCISLV